MAVAELAELENLRDDLLYVFVAGPAVGEGVAVALPARAGWLVVDGASVGAESIPARLVRSFAPGYPPVVQSFVLTHPHEDHVKGVPQLLEQFPPAEVWVTAERPEGPHLLEVCEARLRDLRRLPRAAQDKLRGVRAALVAIARWLDTPGRALSCAVDGQQIRIPACPASVRVRAPSPGAPLSQILAELADGRHTRANEASVVLEIEFGRTRIVLGGDLPRVRTKKTLAAAMRATPLPTGWASVMAAHPHLSQHALLKLAHHGSVAAWDPALMPPPPRPSRSWVVTPFARSRLPRADLATDLVSRQAPLRVTHPPAAWAPLGGWSWRAGAVRTRAKAEPTGDAFADGADDIRPTPATDPLSPVWAFAFDAAGALRGEWRGDSAIEVTN